MATPQSTAPAPDFLARLRQLGANGIAEFWDVGSSDRAEAFLLEAHALAALLATAFEYSEIQSLNPTIQTTALRSIETLITLGLHSLDEASREKRNGK